MRILFISFIFILCLQGIENPYAKLNIEQKLQILIEYFIQKQIKAYFPKKPQKAQVDDKSPIKIVKFERYYNYIQRLKYIKEQRELAKKQAIEEYNRAIEEYNKKILKLKQYYTDTNHFSKIVNIALNNSFKIFYGKPIILKPYLKDNKIYAKIIAREIYSSYKYSFECEVVIDGELSNDEVERLLKSYREIKVLVVFDYNFNKKILQYKNVILKFHNKSYKGIFVKQPAPYKIDIKLDDKIFQLIKKGEKC